MPQRPFRHPPSAEMAVTGRFNRRKADFGSCSDLPLGFMRTMTPVRTTPRARKETVSPVRKFALAASLRRRASSLSGAHDFGVAPSRLAVAFQAGPWPAPGPARA